MDRRGLLRRVSAGTVVALAGCVGRIGGGPASDGDEGAGEGPRGRYERLGSDLKNWNGAVLDVETGPGVDLHQALDLDLMLVLTGDWIQTALYEGDAQPAHEALQEAGYRLVRAVAANFRGVPICASNGKVVVPGSPTESEVRSAFPNPVDVAAMESASGGTWWIIYSRLATEAELSERVEQLSVDRSRSSVIVYTGCDWGS